MNEARLNAEDSILMGFCTLFHVANFIPLWHIQSHAYSWMDVIKWNHCLILSLLMLLTRGNFIVAFIKFISMDISNKIPFTQLVVAFKSCILQKPKRSIIHTIIKCENVRFEFTFATSKISLIFISFKQQPNLEQNSNGFYRLILSFSGNFVQKKSRETLCMLHSSLDLTITNLVEYSNIQWNSLMLWLLFIWLQWWWMVEIIFIKCHLP